MIWLNTLRDSRSTQLQSPIGCFSGQSLIKNFLPAWCAQLCNDIAPNSLSKLGKTSISKIMINTTFSNNHMK